MNSRLSREARGDETPWERGSSATRLTSWQWAISQDFRPAILEALPLPLLVEFSRLVLNPGELNALLLQSPWSEPANSPWGSALFSFESLFVLWWHPRSLRNFRSDVRDNALNSYESTHRRCSNHFSYLLRSSAYSIVCASRFTEWRSWFDPDLNHAVNQPMRCKQRNSSKPFNV